MKFKASISIAVLAVALLALPGLSAAATAPGVPTPGMGTPSAPTSSGPAAPDAFTKQVIQFDDSAAENPAAKDVAARTTGGGLEPARVIMALGGVLGLIFLLRWFMKKVAPGVAGQRSTRAMKVLSRCMVSPRQHILLVQVGRRLVLVGEGGSQLSALCEITDADEVSALLLQLGEDRTAPASRFTGMFGRARKEFSEEEIEKFPEPNRDIAQVSEDDEDDTERGADPAIAATRQELAGLSDKVRGLARNFGER